MRKLSDCPTDIKNQPVLRMIWNATHDNKMNQIIVTNGLPRTGKSELNIYLAWALYRGQTKDFEHKFDVSKHVSFEKIGFQKSMGKYMDIGACLDWEEAGIAELGANAREFWSQSNRAMSTLFQVMGFGRQVCLISLPMKMMLDKHLRSLCHVYIETFKVKVHKNRCIAKVWLNEMSSRKGELYQKYPRYSVDGVRSVIRSISVPRPPKEVLEEYWWREQMFKEWLKEKLIREEEGRQKIKQFKEGGSLNQRLSEVLEKVKADPATYWDYKKNKPDVNSLRIIDNLSLPSAYAVVSLWKKQVENKECEV